MPHDLVAKVPEINRDSSQFAQLTSKAMLEIVDAMGLGAVITSVDELSIVVSGVKDLLEGQKIAIQERMQRLEDDKKFINETRDAQSLRARLLNAFGGDPELPITNDALIKQALKLSNQAEQGIVHGNTVSEVQKALGFNAPGFYDPSLIVMQVKKRHDDLESLRKVLNECQAISIAEHIKIVRQRDAFGNILTDYIHSAAIRDVMAEREKQVTVKGYTARQDDAYGQGVLSTSAAAYASPSLYEFAWAFRPDSFKPSDDPRRNWVKACAMLIAEIEKYDRSQAVKPKAAATPSEDALGPTQPTAAQLREADRNAGATGRAGRDKRWAQRDGMTRPEEQ